MAEVVIVTGASRGIGRAIVSYLARSPRQCHVVAVSRSAALLKQLQDEFSPELVQLLAGDLSSPSVQKEAVDLALKWGRLDGLVVNHGAVEPVGKIADMELKGWRQGLETNVISAIGVIQASLQHLRKHHGRIILTSSGAAVKATSAWAVYCMSKSSLNCLARQLAAEEPDITTIAIRPGVVDTEMQETLAREHFAKMKESDADRFKSLRSEGKMLKPEQPGNVMAKLALNADKELSGAFLDWNAQELKEFQ